MSYVDAVVDRADHLGVTTSPVYHVVCRDCSAGEGIELDEHDAEMRALRHGSLMDHTVTYERVDQ